MQPEDIQAQANDEAAIERFTSMRWTRIGGTIVLVHAATPIVPGEWARYCRDVVRLRPAGIFVLVAPGCPGPDANGRRTMGTAVKEAGKPPVAVLTHSTLHRHIITGMNWIGGGSMVAFAPDDVEGALAHLRIGPAEQAAVLSAASERARQLGVADAFPAIPPG